MQFLVPQSQNGLVVGDIKSLLKFFRVLRKAVRAKPLRKNKDLEKIAHKEAEEEFTAELKKRQAGFTFPPGKSHVTPNKTSKSEQKKLQERFDLAIEARAEKRYRSMDKKYDAKLRGQDEKIQSLIQKIDHTITPISNELRQYTEANKTLLIADWQELRGKVSFRDFIIPEMQEQVDRTIIALETLIRRLRWKRIKSLMSGVKWFLDWLNKILSHLRPWK